MFGPECCPYMDNALLGAIREAFHSHICYAQQRDVGPLVLAGKLPLNEKDGVKQGTRTMFRAEICLLSNGLILKMEGKLVDGCAEQAKCLIAETAVPEPFVVDITDVSYIDDAGERVLWWFRSIGAVFVVKGVYGAGVCERLHLPLRAETTDASNERGTESGF